MSNQHSRCLMSSTEYSLRFLMLKCSLDSGISENTHLLIYHDLLAVCVKCRICHSMPVYAAFGCCKEVRPRYPSLFNLVYQETLSSLCGHISPDPGMAHDRWPRVTSQGQGIYAQSLATVFIIIFVFRSPRPLPCINKKSMNSDGNQMALTVRSSLPHSTAIIYKVQH